MKLLNMAFGIRKIFVLSARFAPKTPGFFRWILPALPAFSARPHKKLRAGSKGENHPRFRLCHAKMPRHAVPQFSKDLQNPKASESTRREKLCKPRNRHIPKNAPAMHRRFHRIPRVRFLPP